MRWLLPLLLCSKRMTSPTLTLIRSGLKRMLSFMSTLITRLDFMSGL